MQDLTNQTAVVTGASQGIGKAIAFGLANLGMNVVLIARSEDLLSAVAEQINQTTHGTAIALAADVGCFEQTKAAFKIVEERFISIDVVFANAGTNKPQGSLKSLQPKDIFHALESNVLGIIHTFKCALELIDASKGASLISIGSGIGHLGASNNSVYAATKGASWAFTKSLGLELADTSICVNELIPGPVKTQMNPTAEGPTWKSPEEVVPLALELAKFRGRKAPTAQSFSLMRR